MNTTKRYDQLFLTKDAPLSHNVLWIEKRLGNDISNENAFNLYIRNNGDWRNILQQVWTNKEAIDAIDLSPYATKTWVENKNYATEDWVEDLGYLTEHQSLAGYATLSWVEGKGYLTLHQDLSGYSTKSYVNTLISQSISGITSFNYLVVSSLPLTGIKGTIYLVPETINDTNTGDDISNDVEEDTISVPLVIIDTENSSTATDYISLPSGWDSTTFSSYTTYNNKKVFFGSTEDNIVSVDSINTEMTVGDYIVDNGIIEEDRYGLMYTITNIVEQEGTNIEPTDSNTTDPSNIYTEYIWVNNAFEKLGNREINLEDYATKEWVNDLGFLKLITGYLPITGGRMEPNVTILSAPDEDSETTYGASTLALVSQCDLDDNTCKAWIKIVSSIGENPYIEILEDLRPANTSSYVGTEDTPFNRMYTSNGFYQTSDINKKNIHEEISLDKAYDMLNKCLSIIYDLKDDPKHKEQIGMIALEVEKFFPLIVTTGDKNSKSLDYSRLTVILFRVMKDLINRIQKLEDK